jgi:O-antigen ligase
VTAWIAGGVSSGFRAALLAAQVAIAVPMTGVMFLDRWSFLVPVSRGAPSEPLACPCPSRRAAAVYRLRRRRGRRGLISTIVHAPGQRPPHHSSGVAHVLWFIYLVALAKALDPDGATLLVLTLAVACAASAALNLFLFFTLPIEALPVEAQIRLAPIIGMASARFSTTLSATYAVLAAAAFAIAVGPGRSTAIRVVAALAAAVLGVALALTQTRSAYLAVAAAVVAVAACLSPRLRWAILAVLVAAALVVLFYPPAFDVVIRRGSSYRPGTWMQFLPSFAERPLFGIGQREPIRIIVDGAEINHPHNLVLSAQVRGGILAFVGMLAMLVGGLVAAWRFARRRGDPFCHGEVAWRREPLRLQGSCRRTGPG